MIQKVVSLLFCAGPFTAGFRGRAIEAWARACKGEGIPFAKAFKLVDVLGDPLQVCNLSQTSWLI